MKRHIRVLLASVVIVGIPAAANATTVNITSISGTWTSATPAINASGIGTSAITWGGVVPPSGYTFAAAGTPFSALAGSQFSLGSFTHINNPIPSGSSITQATLSLAITFNGDFFNDGNADHVANSVFVFNHNETTNNTPPAGCCDDIVTAVTNVGASSQFTIEGVEYTFGITGFQIGGNNFLEFFSPEGGSNMAFLLGSFDAVPVFDPNADPVPLPGALVLFLSGLAGMFGLSLRKKLKQA